MEKLSDSLLTSLLRAMKSIREVTMRAQRMAEFLRHNDPHEVNTVLMNLLAAGGSGHLSKSMALSSLVSVLQDRPALPYATRALLYNQASEQGWHELAYLFLEGAKLEEIIEETPTRALVPGRAMAPLGARKSAARGSDRIRLTHLLKDSHPQVVAIVLENPLLREQDVVVMASLRPTQALSLRAIATHPRWHQKRRVRLAVALNPSSALPLACQCSVDLADSELVQIRDSPGLGVTLRGHTSRLLELRRKVRTPSAWLQGQPF